MTDGTCFRISAWGPGIVALMLGGAGTSLAQDAAPTTPSLVFAALRDTILALYVDPIPAESLSRF